MFNEPTDLSPDLEWMLRSDQVDDETIAEALARQYYQRIYYLALSCLTYPWEVWNLVKTPLTILFKHLD